MLNRVVVMHKTQHTIATIIVGLWPISNATVKEKE